MHGVNMVCVELFYCRCIRPCELYNIIYIYNIFVCVARVACVACVFCDCVSICVIT